MTTLSLPQEYASVRTAFQVSGCVIAFTCFRFCGSLKICSASRARSILQIHDELLIEAPLEEEEEVKNLLTDRMKHAASLQVALEVEAQTGASWFDAK